MFINILNTSQNNKEANTETRTLNELEKDFTGHSIFQGYTQTSDFIFNTQERSCTNLPERSNIFNDYYNQNNTSSPVEELGNQNCISLEALKGKMSQDIAFDSDLKNRTKNNSDLNWQEGKVSIKKGKVKVECNYAFTPTKSSLRVRCIYCKKIYFSVKGFISHRGRCIYYKTFQNTQNENNSQNNSSNKYSLNTIEKSIRKNQQILNSLMINQNIDNGQYNSKVNTSLQYTSNEDPMLFSYNTENRLTFEEKESQENLIIQNLVRKSNENFQMIESEKNTNSSSSQFEFNKKLNYKLENRNLYHDKIDAENFKMHLYAAISCLPKSLVAKILKKKNPEVSNIIDNKSEDEITKEELIDMIFVGIEPKSSKDNSEQIGKTNKELFEQNKLLLNKFQIKEIEKPELELESVKSESYDSNKNCLNDEIFQLNIPVFFRHSFPKDSEWKCYICKAPRSGKENMRMCVNCGYVYHLTCQNQMNKIAKNDWFCDYCKTHGNKLKPGSKFQIGELVWVNYRGTFWPGQIMEYSKDQFEIFIFHIEKRLEKCSSEILPWSKGIISIDGLASKGTFLRESASSVMHWQSVYKAIKYYMYSLRSKQRRLPQIKTKKDPVEFKVDDSKKMKIEKIVLNDSSSGTQVCHPIPSEIKEGMEQEYNETNFLNICPQVDINCE